MEENLSTAGEELKDMKKQLSSLEEEVEQARKQRDEVQSRSVEFFFSFLLFSALLSPLPVTLSFITIMIIFTTSF